MSGFFEELQRRKVYRVAAAYVVAAGFLIQIAAAAFPAWELPNWSLRLVIALLLIGFPVALLLAWAYDITTDLLDLRVAPGKGVPRHTHTREDEALFVISGELEATVGDEIFTLRAGETLIAPRNIPHQLRNSGDVTNHYLIMFSPAGFEEFLKATSVPAPDNAVAPTEPPTTAIRNVFELAADYGIEFG